jgi:VCBS repeat-containing protein
VPPNQWSSQPALVDTRGRFVIEGLGDGNYEVNANVIVTLPDGMAKRFSEKQQVTIQDGSVVNVTISIDLTGNP